MFAWIADNAATIIAIIIVLLLIGIAVLSIIRDKKSKKGVCTGNCSTCGMSCSYSKKRK
ncbi:MAG: FeoB-associated Cys-rich membrane protein [Clostridia bacterium]|nr:FeoB-associated Cys-rich membrane protein [Clostridia bacterium]